MSLGVHILFELSDCDQQSLKETAKVREIMIAAARGAGATVVTDVFHQFSPVGVSGVVVIAESHLAIHTWPEHRYAAVDVFTCGLTIDMEILEMILVNGFGSKSLKKIALSRGPGGAEIKPETLSGFLITN